MILTHSFLQKVREDSLYASSTGHQQRIKNNNDSIFSKKQQFDVFLSHSSLDREEVINLVQLFNNCGYSVYVDWLYDYQLDRTNVTPNTATLLRNRMNDSKGLAYLATGNATNSKWCPWELGYFDGKSRNSRCCILPVLMSSSTTYSGQEYLGLYPYIEYAQIAGSGTYDFWVCEQNSSKYVSLRMWLEGTDPYNH